MNKLLIIGGVAGGATAAARARRLNSDIEIIMLEAGPDVSFANCGLPYYIGGDIKSRSKLILQSPESFKDQYNVDVHINTKATSIDAETQIVTAVDQQTGTSKQFNYDKLILAQGGKPIIPPFPGAELEHVYSLWTLEDMDRIQAEVTENNPHTAVIAGGGFIGLEMAEALAHRGIKVHIVEKMPHVMSIMEGETAGFIQQELEAYGVSTHTNKGVSEIKTDKVILDDGSEIQADMVLLSVGVKPTLTLAQETGLSLGEAGGLLVNEFLQTSNENIYAAGDMVEIEHRVSQKKVRIPLAGPANRQGRIAATNALGGKMSYKGSIGTSVVRVFDAVAGTTGLSLKQARQLGLNADASTVHKEHHTSYYPGATPVSVTIVFDRDSGIVLGGQTAGYKGADKRLDVLATATAHQLSVSDLAEVDYSYSPPIGTANDAINMAAYTAENKFSGYSPAVYTSELDSFVKTNEVEIVDVRDIFSYQKYHIEGARNIPLTQLPEKLVELSQSSTILVIDETGKKGHQALRQLVNAGFENVFNVSGGYTSLERYARTIGFKNLTLELPEVESKSLEEDKEEINSESIEEAQVEQSGRLIVDVRTPEEVATGAYPGSVNIPLDSLPNRVSELGATDREIILYCASGARSGYAQRLLLQLGFSNVSNAGGIMQIMASMPPEKEAEEPQPVTNDGPLVVDVRTPEEFAGGAYPGALNIPVDEVQARIDEFGSKDRAITVYCASGARSAYAQRVLMQLGYSDVTNGGGIMQMMS